MNNISKTRTFPENKYEIYDLKKADVGRYVNTWFKGDYIEKKGIVYTDEMWTVKRVDKDTAMNLYHRVYNPISINFYNTYPVPKIGTVNVKAMIHSIDDSSFGMWANNVTLETAKDLRQILMNYLDEKTEVNGKEWFDFGESIGFTDFDTN